MTERFAGNELSRIASDDLPWLAYPLIAKTSFKIVKVNEATNTVILRFRMSPWTVTPKHRHHCVATAYTLAGAWYYDDLEFRAGDLAFECTSEPHQPVTRDLPAELVTTFIGGRGNDALLEEYDDQGRSRILRTRFFKALEGIDERELRELDLSALID